MFKRKETSNYTMGLIEKENKRLIRENEYLKKELDSIKKYKEEYETLIGDIKKCKVKYEKLIENVRILESELKSDVAKKNKVMNEIDTN